MGEMLVQPAVFVPDGLELDAQNRCNGLLLLRELRPLTASPFAFFDPQYRGILDHQRYGNEGRASAGQIRNAANAGISEDKTIS